MSNTPATKKKLLVSDRSSRSQGAAASLTEGLPQHTPRKTTTRAEDTDGKEQTPRRLTYSPTTTQERERSEDAGEDARPERPPSPNEENPEEVTPPELPPPRLPTPPLDPPPSATMQMEELKKRVDEMVKAQWAIQEAELDIRRQQLNDDRIKMLADMERRQIAMDQDATERAKACTSMMKDTGSALANITPKANEEVRKPSKFGKPTLGSTTKVFFQDYERYVRGWKPLVPDATAIYLSQFLQGDALAFYDRQSPDIKDTYNDIKEAVLQYFQEEEEELTDTTVKPFDPKKQTIGEYLKEVKEFFSAKKVTDEEAINNLKLTMKGEFKEAITIHKPKTWTDLGRWLRNAQSSNKTTHGLQAMMEVAPQILDSYSLPLRQQMEEMQALLKESKETQETVAAMGGGKPVYYKAAKTEHVGKYPTLPPGHVINPKYNGPPEKYDPYFLDKVRARKQKSRESQAAAPAKEAQPAPPAHPQPPYNPYPPPHYPPHQEYGQYPPYYPPYQPHHQYPPYHHPQQPSSAPQQAPAAGTQPALMWPYPYHYPPAPGPAPTAAAPAAPPTPAGN